MLPEAECLEVVENLMGVADWVGVVAGLKVVAALMWSSVYFGQENFGGGGQVCNGAIYKIEQTITVCDWTTWRLGQ